MSQAGQTAIKAAMTVAGDVAEGRLHPAELDAAAVEACRALVGVVAGPEDPLWSVQLEVCRGVLAAGGVPAGELAEWLAVARRREGGAQVEAERSAHKAHCDPPASTESNFQAVDDHRLSSTPKSATERLT